VRQHQDGDWGRLATLSADEEVEVVDQQALKLQMKAMRA